MNACAACGLGAPIGISMLVDQSIRPSLGITNSMSGLSGCSCTASPDQPIATQLSPFG